MSFFEDSEEEEEEEEDDIDEQQPVESLEVPSLRRRTTLPTLGGLHRSGTFRRKAPPQPVVSVERPPLHFYIFRRAYIKLRTLKSEGGMVLEKSEKIL